MGDAQFVIDALKNADAQLALQRADAREVAQHRFALGGQAQLRPAREERHAVAFLDAPDVVAQALGRDVGKLRRAGKIQLARREQEHLKAGRHGGLLRSIGFLQHTENRTAYQAFSCSKQLEFLLFF